MMNTRTARRVATLAALVFMVFAGFLPAVVPAGPGPAAASVAGPLARTGSETQTSYASVLPSSAVAPMTAAATAPPAGASSPSRSSEVATVTPQAVPVAAPLALGGASQPMTASASLSTSPSRLAGWEGAQYGSNHGALDYVDPPDVPIAVGPNHVFELVNGIGLIWTKSGTFVKLVNPQTLFGVGSSDGIGDARVLYDALSGRWFASAGDFTTGNVVLAVSATGDPTGSWSTYAFATGSGCPDQPYLGTGSDKVVLSLNTFAACDGSFVGGMFWAINKTDLLSGASARYATFGPSLSYLNMYAVQAMTASTTVYLVRPIPPSWYRLYALTGVPPATVTVSYHDYSVSTIGTGVNAVQPGTNYTIQVGDTRARDAFWSAGRLWVTLNDGCIPSGDTLNRSCVRLTQLDTTNQTVLQNFDFGATGAYYFYAALRTDAAGNLLVVLGTSSSSVYPNVVVTARSPSDPANTLGPLTVARAGTGSRTPTSSSCSSGICRYGDYFGAAVDPSNASRVYLAGEYGNTTGWGTYVSLWSVPGSAPPPPPPPATVTLTLSYSVQGGGPGYQAPTLTYVLNGTTRTATLTTTPTGYTADANSAWSVTNPLGGSASSERWSTSQVTAGTATASTTIAFTYYHQFLVTFGYQVLGGGSGFSAPTVSYAAFGASTSTTTGTAVWADAGSAYTYPGSLPGSSSSEAWRTRTVSGSITAAGTLSATYYHQFSVTFAYALLGGGSGYTAPTVSTTQFGGSVPIAAGVATWVDAGAAYAYTNPLAGSGASERWIAASASGTVNSAGTPTVTYYHEYQVTFAYSVANGGTGYSAPTVTYAAMGNSASTGLGVAVWADAGSAYAFQNPLPGSTGTVAWRTNGAAGSVGASGTIRATYYYQFFVAFLVQVVNGNLPPTMPALAATVYGGTMSIPAGGSSWVDANGSYSFPGTFSGASGERWQSGAPPSGIITLPATITAVYYHQYSVTFAYQVTGGGSGYGGPAVTYAALGSTLAATTGSTVWADAGSAFTYAATLSGSSSSERWQTAAPGGTVLAAGTVTVTYLHQFWIDFTYAVTGGGSGYSAPNVTYSNLTMTGTTTATALWGWADSGSGYVYQNPLPGSTSTNSWRTNNGMGTVKSSATYSATYKHQYKVRFKATTTSGTPTPEAPMINCTVFGATVSVASGNDTWVDADGAYSFPAVFYGPLPGERWTTDAPPSGLVLAPMNVTAVYVHQHYLALQVNAAAGGSVTGTPGWYNETTSVTLTATAAAGWQFEGWIGSGTGSYTGPTTGATVSLDAPITETAVFYAGLTLTASSGGSLAYSYGGTSGWVPAGGSETLYLAPGTNVTVTAAPSLFYQFDGWRGGGSTTSVQMITVNSPQSLAAGFGISLYSKVDSVLGVALLATALVLVALASRRRRRKKEKAMRVAQLRARARPQTYR